MLTSALSVLCPPSPSQEFELEASQSEHFFFLWEYFNAVGTIDTASDNSMIINLKARPVN